MLRNAHQSTHQHRQLAPLGLEEARPAARGASPWSGIDGGADGGSDWTGGGGDTASAWS